MSSAYFLIGHPGSLGDVLLALPAMRAIRRTFPDSELILLAQTAVGRLLSLCGEIQHAWSIDGGIFGELMSDAARFPVSIEIYLRRSSRAIFWLRSSHAVLQDNLRRLGVSDPIIKSPITSELAATHMADRYLECLRPYCVVCPDGDACLAFPPMSCDHLGIDPVVRRVVDRSRHEPLVVIHPGSGSPHKNCSPQLWAEVMRGLADRYHVSLILCGGPSDARAILNVQHALGPLDYTTVLNKDLVSIAWLLSHAAVFIGHDSGLTHLAAAMGTKTLALFGPTDPAKWGPRGKHVVVHQAEPCRCGNWATVQACLDKPCLQFEIPPLLGLFHELIGDSGSPWKRN